MVMVSKPENIAFVITPDKLQSFLAIKDSMSQKAIERSDKHICREKTI